MLALAIAGGAVVVLLGNIHHSMMMYRVARETVAATQIARQKLQEVLGKKDGVREGRDAGRWRDDPTYEWAVQIEPATLPGLAKDDVKGVLRVAVTISWDREAHRHVRLVQITPEGGAP